MKQFEKIVGNVLAGLLIALVLVSIFLTMFRFLFRDGRGMGMYGSRGDFYMAE